jgi:hypothetical protein
MSPTSSVLRGVSRAVPCLVCNGTRRCVYSTDGLLMCRYRKGPQPGFRDFGQARGDPGWSLYRALDDRNYTAASSAANQPALNDIPGLAYRLAGRITEAERQDLAQRLKLPTHSLDALATIGYDPQEHCWTFPERDAKEHIVGLVRRYGDGRKKSAVGSRRGLTIPEEWHKVPGPILIVEGASDVLALCWLRSAQESPLPRRGPRPGQRHRLAGRDGAVGPGRFEAGVKFGRGTGDAGGSLRRVSPRAAAAGCPARHGS